MIDRTGFAALREGIEAYDAARDRIIKRSRDITKASKAAIYAMHRGDLAGAKEQLLFAREGIADLLPAIAADPTLRTGSFSGGMEEHVEAIAFLRFLEHHDLLRKQDVPEATAEEYLGALSDLTGELVRHCVLRATRGDRVTAQRVRDLVDAIHGELALFDFRNGELRRKYDAVKYALQKSEQVLYDLSLRPGHVPEDA